MSYAYIYFYKFKNSDLEHHLRVETTIADCEAGYLFLRPPVDIAHAPVNSAPYMMELVALPQLLRSGLLGGILGGRDTKHLIKV